MKYKLGDTLAEELTITDRNIINAFNRIDRKEFIPPAEKTFAYADFPLPIGYGQTISQPTTVGFMLQLLSPRKGDKVLDLGSGSGWTTALLGDIVGPDGYVIGVELIPELVEIGRLNLNKYPELPAEIRQAKYGTLGDPDDAPFDKILVSAAAEESEQSLIDQLKIGGDMVMPIGGSIFLIRKNGNGLITTEEYPGFAFVPLVKKI